MGGTLLRLPASPAGGVQEDPPDLPGGRLRPRSGTEPASEETSTEPEPQAAAPEALPQSSAPSRPGQESTVRLRYDLRPGVTFEGTHDSSRWFTARDVDNALGIGHRPGGPTRSCGTMRTCTAACLASTTACATP